MVPGVIALSGDGATQDFCVGDVIGDGRDPLCIITAIDHGKGTLKVVRASRWHRARWWLRGQWLDAAFALRCWWAEFIDFCGGG